MPFDFFKKKKVLGAMPSKKKPAAAPAKDMDGDKKLDAIEKLKALRAK